MSKINEAYKSVRQFNAIAGNLGPQTQQELLEGIYNQINFIYEELNETSDALNNEDAKELLDGACDLFVTVAGLMQKLEAAGMNVKEALLRVCYNNMDKFPLAMYAKPQMCPEGAKAEERMGYTVYIRESDGKVMKPTTFQSVDIEDCVVDIFQEAI